MTVTISIPPTLRRLASGCAEVSVDAARLDLALDELASLHPDLWKQTFTSDRRMRPFVRLFVNNRDCTRFADPARPLAHGDRITLISAFAGG